MEFFFFFFFAMYVALLKCSKLTILDYLSKKTSVFSNNAGLFINEWSLNVNHWLELHLVCDSDLPKAVK